MAIYCETCDDYTPHRHLHDTAHGIPETHMAGTERYQCTRCGNSIHASEGKLKGLRFLYD